MKSLLVGLWFVDKPKDWRVKDSRPRTVLTEFGEVAFTCRIYLDPPNPYALRGDFSVAPIAVAV